MLTPLLLALGLYAGLLALIDLGQARLVFIPNDRTLVGTPGDLYRLDLATLAGKTLQDIRAGLMLIAARERPYHADEPKPAEVVPPSQIKRPKKDWANRVR